MITHKTQAQQQSVSIDDLWGNKTMQGLRDFCLIARGSCIHAFLMQGDFSFACQKGNPKCWHRKREKHETIVYRPKHGTVHDDGTGPSWKI